MIILSLFLFASSAVIVITPAVIKIARRFGILDIPNEPRKIHATPIPLIGGLAPYLGFVALMILIMIFAPALLAKIPSSHLIAVMIAGLVLMIGGLVDDKWNLSPAKQIIFPIIAAMIIVFSGIEVKEITNPFGGVFRLSSWMSQVFIFVWLMGMMYTTKFLDGLDGLVSGLTAIGSAMILLLAITTQWYQPEVAVLAAIASGAFVGFLFWNFNPAKIFLGTGGSLFAGFILGTLAIISGGKIATALLVFGVPILDAVWVILRRIFWEKRSPTRADRKHLHFRLLDVGLGQRGAVLLFYVIAALFGVTTLVLQSREKLVALGILLILVIIGGAVLVLSSKRKTRP